MQLTELLDRSEKTAEAHGYVVKETCFNFTKENGVYRGAIIIETSDKKNNEIVGWGSNVDEILFNLQNEMHKRADEQITFQDLCLGDSPCKVKFYAHVDLGEEVVELPDNYTDEQIEEHWREWRNDMVDSGWYKLNKNSEEEQKLWQTAIK